LQRRSSWTYFVQPTRKSAKNPTPPVGLLKLKPLRPGERRYAVAIRDAGLWLTLWVARSPANDVYVMVPRANKKWAPHASYHASGRFHSKSFNAQLGPHQTRQALNSAFCGRENVGAFGGHGVSIDAICDPSDFSDVIEVPPGVLGGAVSVDLVAPGIEPDPWVFALSGGKVVCEKNLRRPHSVDCHSCGHDAHLNGSYCRQMPQLKRSSCDDLPGMKKGAANPRGSLGTPNKKPRYATRGF
jgi:hypothetical protein